MMHAARASATMRRPLLASCSVWLTVALLVFFVASRSHADSGAIDGFQNAAISGTDSFEESGADAEESLVEERASLEIPVGLVNNTPKVLNLLPGPGNASYYSFSVAKRNNRRYLLGGQDRESSRHDTLTDDKGNTAKTEAKEAEMAAVGTDIEPRQASVSTPVFVSINTCLQPSFVNKSLSLDPPQLALYVSTSSSNMNPGPNAEARQQTRIPLVEGFAQWRGSTDDNLFLGVAAPQVDIVADTVWNYEIAVSTNAYYHSYNDTGVSMFLTDSDPGAALLVTDKLAWLAPDNSSAAAIDSWAVANLPLTVLAANTNDTAVRGVMRSYCGLNNVPSVISAANTQIRNGVTHNQPDAVAEQQFYVPGLNHSSTYFGILARHGNGSAAGVNVVGGGGTIFPAMTFPTKRDYNCAVIYNLTFCSTVEYAVPANPAHFPDVDALKQLYDDEAQQRYQNFSYSLQQIACNTTSTAQYSLARTCDDCAESYKTWLCAVTIPRCEDFSAPLPVQIPRGPADAVNDDDREQAGAQGYLMPRNLAQAPIAGAQVGQSLLLLDEPSQMTWLATNSSRNNDTIAGLIQPGPYHEVLPCEDLCFSLVRDCPAKLGFVCPEPGSRMLRASYGRRGQSSNGASLCSAPGSVYRVSAAVPGAAVHWTLLCVAVCLVLFSI